MATGAIGLVRAPIAAPPREDWFGFLIRVLSPREAADYLRVPEAVVIKEAAEGRLPGRKVGDEWRFLGGELVRWLYEGTSAAPVAASLEERLAVAGCLAGDETLKSIVEDAYRRREEDKVGGRK